MPRRKRILALHEDDLDYRPPRVTRRITRELLMSQHQPINNLPSATTMESDSTSATVTEENMEELTLNVTETINELNNNYCKEINDTASTEEKLGDLNRMIREENDYGGNKKQELKVVLNAAEIVNRSDRETKAKSPTTKVETCATKIKPKPKPKPKRVGRSKSTMPRKVIKSMAKMENASSTCEVISMAERLDKKLNDLPTAKPVEAELNEKSKSEVKLGHKSEFEKPKAAPGKTFSTIDKSPMCTKRQISSKKFQEIGSVKKDLPRKLKDLLQEQPVECKMTRDPISNTGKQNQEPETDLTSKQVEGASKPVETDIKTTEDKASAYNLLNIDSTLGHHLRLVEEARPSVALMKLSDDIFDMNSVKPKRGRPRKNVISTKRMEKDSNSESGIPRAKKQRGRKNRTKAVEKLIAALSELGTNSQIKSVDKCLLTKLESDSEVMENKTSLDNTFNIESTSKLRENVIPKANIKSAETIYASQHLRIILGAQPLVSLTRLSEKSKGRPLATVINTERIGENCNSELKVPKKGRERKSRAKASESTDSQFNSDDDTSSTKVATDSSLLEKLKAKRVGKRLETVVVSKKDKKLKISDSTDGSIKAQFKSADEPLSTEVATDSNLPEKPKANRVPKSQTEVSKEIVVAKNMEINNNPVSKTEDKNLGSYLKVDLPSEPLNPKYLSNSTTKDVAAEISSVKIENAKTNGADLKKVRNSSVENNLRSPGNRFSVILENKYLLLEEIHQPKVLLEDVAYSDILSPKQKELLHRSNKSQASCGSKISFNSTIGDETMEKSTMSKPLSAEIVERHTEKMEIQTFDAKEVEEIRKRKTKKPRSKVLSPSKRRTKKLAKDDDCGNELKTSMILPEQNLGTSPIFNKMDSKSTVDSSIQSLDLLTSDRCASANPMDTMTEKLCSATEAHEISFGNSVIDETDHSASSVAAIDDFKSKKPEDSDERIEISEDPTDLAESKDANNSSKTIEILNDAKELTKSEDANHTSETVEVLKNPKDMAKSEDVNHLSATIKILKKPTHMPKSVEDHVNETIERVVRNELEDETITMYVAPEPVKHISKKVDKSVSKRTKDRVKPQICVPVEERSLKVSIPVRHYYNKRCPSIKKLDEVLTQEKKFLTKAETKSYVDDKLNKITPSESESKTKSNSDKKHHESSSKSPKLLTSIKKHVKKMPSEIKARISDKPDSKLPEPMRILEVKPKTVSKKTPEHHKQQTIMNVRSLPKIVVDQILPKGTITFTPVRCESEMTIAGSGTNMDREMGELEIEKETTHYMIDVDETDNLNKFKNMNKLLPVTAGTTTPQVDLSSKNIPADTATESEEQHPSVVGEHYDPITLLNICPELATFLGHEDIVNNNQKNVSDINVESEHDDDKVNGLVNANETPLNIEDTEEIPVNDMKDVTEDRRDVEDRKIEGVVATKADYTEIEGEETVATQSELSSMERSVLADLTTDNLRNFNNISNCNNEGGLNWSVETCEYYLSREDVAKHGDQSLPGVAIEVGCKSKESFVKSSKQISESESKKRKRKWVSDEKHTDLEPVKKKLKLNRQRWSGEGQGGETISNTQRQTSHAESISSANSSVKRIVKNTPSPKRISDAQLNIVEKTSIEEKNKFGNTENRNEATEANQTNVNYCENNEREDDSTLIAVDSICGADTPILQTEEKKSENPQNYDAGEGFDCNRNSTSSNSSSSSSSRSSETSDKSKISETPDIAKCKENNQEDDVDADYISLFAESIFTNVDLAPNLVEASSLSSLFDGAGEYDRKFPDIVNNRTYVEKNIKECNEAYESCALEDKSMRNTSENIMQNYFNENHNRVTNQEANINSLNFVNREFGRRSPPATIIQRPVLNRDLLRPKIRQSYVMSHGVEHLFHRNCFSNLKYGFCKRRECFYSHILSQPLQVIQEQPPSILNDVLDYAIGREWMHFVNCKYSDIVTQVDYPMIIKFFFKLADACLMTDQFICRTFSASQRFGVTLSEFVQDVTSLFKEGDDSLAQLILTSLSDSAEQGFFWETFRPLLIKIQSSAIHVNRVMQECIAYRKNRAHVEDVYVNYLRNLTRDQDMSINMNVRRDFDFLLMEYNLIHRREENSNWNVVDRNIDGTNWREKNVNDYHSCVRIPLILSPDDAACHDVDNLSHFSDLSEHPSLNSVCRQEFDDTKKKLYQSTEPINHKIIQITTKRERISAAKDISSNVKAGKEPSNVDAYGGTWKLHPIDDLKPPRSAFHDRHWIIHMAMQNLEEALKHKQYRMALKILNKFSNGDKSLYMLNCYRMLRTKVMESAVHVKNMIKLSVLMGVKNSLIQTLTTLGMYMTIELCNNNAWIRAYRLFNSLPKSTSLTDNNAEFSLISAEIYIANGRPLKAFNVLKQNNMLSENRAQWRVASNPTDECVRVMIINLILDILCRRHADDATYVFKSVMRNQTRIYHPVDLTAHVDKLATCILNNDCNVTTMELAKLIIENNFAPKNSVFRSLIVKIFHDDLKICRRLYCYGTGIGVYTTTKLTLPLHISIKTDWKKEEMYLVTVDFLEKLSMDIGSAIDSIGPNQFTIHLVFELAPFREQRASNDKAKLSNKEELKISKETMKTVLREEFDPPIKTIIAERERFIKLQCRSVINYLKSMMR